MTPTTTAVLIVCVTVFGVFVIGASVLVMLQADSDGPLLAGLLLSQLATTIPVIASLARTEKVAAQVDELHNGKMDAKIRAGVADVIPGELLDDEYVRHQLAADRIRRGHRSGKVKGAPPVGP